MTRTIRGIGRGKSLGLISGNRALSQIFTRAVQKNGFDMSNPRKPSHLKAISGTQQKCREKIPVVELPLVSDVPAAPDWLPNAHAVVEWNRLAPILHANKLLTEAGCSSLAVLCSLHGKIVQLFAAGECPTGHMLAQYRNLVNDFGLTPVAQGKVKPSQSKEDSGNPFARNGKRTA